MKTGWDSADLDQAISDLLLAGWTPTKTMTIWQAPDGSRHLGPAGAWKTMQRAKNDRRHGNIRAVLEQGED